MPQPLDAVLFDLDGTLLDTAPDMARAANKVLANHGIPPLREHQIQANTSFGAKGLLEAGFDGIPDHLDFTQLRAEFLQYYQQDICLHTRFYDGVEALLEYLEHHAIPWGIMTNKPGFLTDLLLPFFPPLLKAQAIVCGDTLSKAKPHPEPLLYASELIRVPNHRCAYIGDIEKDMMAANAAQMVGYVAGWGYIGEHHNPEEWNAAGILPTPTDIVSLLRN
ncbi:HAD family hydrolase [Photobacterium jeanii]|uniref:HAD family hydrolase n=1 Tax=Photobacterium jeanii TaxID=858640 RepID=A0A178KM85_9GAMM|nr:HAD hydrolase-like protein [Photobacterium jeanii]OAN18310.1 HAD family hydrolase [Photobacterium jeanii]PST92010.1 HAD family hydrolase [Photobacterium jeanii]